MKLKAIHQIEITSRCNLRCVYCVHPKMPRPKQDMDWNTFSRSLNLVTILWEKYHVDRELNLAGIGESTIHPNFLNYVSVARKQLSTEIVVLFATNGVEVTQLMVDRLAEIRDHDGPIGCWVSLHRPEKAQKAVQMLKAKGLLLGISTDPATNSVDWAGQVDWPITSPDRTPCMWLGGGLGMVASNGDILQCCFDGIGRSSIGTVWDNPHELEVKVHELCATCQYPH